MIAGFGIRLGSTCRVNVQYALRPDRLAAVLDRAAGEGTRVSVVSMITVNNETGAINDIAALATTTRDHAPEAVFHTDAVQALSWLDLRTHVAAADLVSITGHKCGGPVGAGALFVRQGITLDPLILGGGQERGRRAGTPAGAGRSIKVAASIGAVGCSSFHRPTSARVSAIIISW